MKINIITPPEDVKRKVTEASSQHSDIKVIEQSIHYKGKEVATYQVTNKGVEVSVTDKPWYISKSLIESRLRELFA